MAKNAEKAARGPSRLGRGLSALLGEAETAEAEDAPRSGVRTLPVAEISPNPDQPRRAFDEAELDDLARSIARHGVLQPVLVRPHPARSGTYQLIAGERRWRAAQKAGVHELPAIIRELSDEETLEFALIENIQRADLNAIEEAEGYRRLIDEFGHSQEALGTLIGKSRSHIANMLRLLQLPDPVKRQLAEGKLSAGQVRPLVGLENATELAAQIAREGLSARAAEALVRTLKEPPASAGATRRKTPRDKDPDTRALERRIAEALGIDVDIRHRNKGGELVLAYGSLEQLDEICRRLCQRPGGVSSL